MTRHEPGKSEAAARVLLKGLMAPTVLLLVALSAFGGGWAVGKGIAGGRAPGRKSWHIEGLPAVEGARAWIDIRNGNGRAASASVSFRAAAGLSDAVNLEVPAGASASIDVNDCSAGMPVAVDIRSGRPVTASLRSYAPPEPQDPGGKAIKVALAQLGKPYSYGAAGPAAFDCSGLAQFCFSTAAGVSLPRTSYGQARSGTPVPAADLRPGDIVGFSGWGHVGIYLGEGRFVHAPHSGDVVRISTLAEHGNLCGAVRI